MNKEWISTDFELDEADNALAVSPNQIIDNGGYVFSWLLNKKVVVFAHYSVKVRAMAMN